MTTRPSAVLRQCFLVVAVAAFYAGSLPARGADAPAKPVELKQLERFIGDWTSAAAVRVLNGEPQDIKTTGKATRKWGLGGWLIEESATSSDGVEAKVIFTYDAAKHAYHSFYFNSAGIGFDSIGQWNDAAQTFSFQADHGNGFIQASTIHFTSADQHEWSSKVTDATGKVWFEGSGVLTRQK